MLLKINFSHLNIQIRTLAALPKLAGLQGECVISCRNRKFNHHVTTAYDKFEEIPLASKGWNHKKSIGDFFKIHPVTNMYAENFVPFESIGIEEPLLNNLKEMNIREATQFQAEAIPQINDKEHIMLAAETGCGKTISYLLPVIQAVLRLQSDLGLNRPKALVLAPNRELAYQIGDVAKKLAQNTNIKVKVVVGGHTKRIMLNPHFGSIDILIGTPGVIGKLSTVGVYKLDQVLFTVLDEADTLLDDSFDGRMTGIIKRIPQSKIVLVSATLPRNLSEVLKPIEPNLTRIISDNLHKPLSNIAQHFIRLSRSNKPAYLMEIAKSNKKPMLVFTNRNKTCDWLAMFLRENGVSCSNINGDMPYEIRIEEWNKFASGQSLVLSATDVGSRGLDTTQVKHVVNYDFPLYAADYLHRVGRVGRLGSVEGSKVTNFISGPEEIKLVQQIELAVRRNEPLVNVDGNITNIVQRKIERGLKQVM